MNYKDYFKETEQPMEKLISDGGFCGIFRTIACIGDSLSSGEFEHVKEDGTTVYADMFEYSWGQFIARTTGSKVYNFSRGGMTAQEYVETFAQANDFWNPDKACQAYIIALGINDLFNAGRKLGSTEDIKEDYSENEPTFAGHYASIIQRIKKEIQPDAKFFLMTMLRNNNPEYNKTIDAHADLLYKIAEKLGNCYVIDFRKYGPISDGLFQKNFYLYGHLTPAGYLLTAKMVMTYIDYIIRHNIHDFDRVGFIGKEYLLK